MSGFRFYARKYLDWFGGFAAGDGIGKFGCWKLGYGELVLILYNLASTLD